MPTEVGELWYRHYEYHGPKAWLGCGTERQRFLRRLGIHRNRTDNWASRSGASSTRTTAAKVCEGQAGCTLRQRCAAAVR